MISQNILKFYSALVCFTQTLRSPFLLVIRLYWGWQFFITGKGKLTNIDRIIHYFHELGIPWPTWNAYLASMTECVGGLLLVIGLFTRVASIPLAFTMVVAYLTAENAALKMIFEKPDAFLSAAPFLFLYAVLILFVFGPGSFSLDRLIQKKLSSTS